MPMRASAPRLPPVTFSRSCPRSFSSSEVGNSSVAVVETPSRTSPFHSAAWSSGYFSDGYVW